MRCSSARCPRKRSRAGEQLSHLTRPHSLKRVKSKKDSYGDAERQQRAWVPAVMPACKQGEAFSAASCSARAETFVGFPCKDRHGSQHWCIAPKLPERMMASMQRVTKAKRPLSFSK